MSDHATPPLDVASMSRRQFLRRMGLATGAALTTSLLTDLDVFAAADSLDPSTPNAPRHFVILGAGLAGLCAAYELEKRGHRCTLLEAETGHIGGRVRTLRFENGLYGEAGAMRIPLRHELTRHYIKEFGLPLRKFVHSNPEAYYYARGHRERIKNVKQLAQRYDLPGSERDKVPDDLWNEAIIRRLEALTDAERAELSSTTFESNTVRALDGQSLQQLCETAGLSPEAIEFLAVTYGMETLMGSAATEHLREEREQVWTQEFHEIVGGTDRLPTAFAARLKSKLRLGCEVVQIEQDQTRRKAAAIYRERSGQLRREEGDFVLCTLPFSVLGRLQTIRAFSGPKQRAIRELNYDSSTKVLAICNRRFWETDDGIFGGGTYTDLPTGTTYYPSDNAGLRNPRISAGPGVMLASYTWGQQARRLATLAHADRSEQVLAHLSRVHPQLAQPGVLRRTASWSWDNHKWNGGAFAWFMPGQHSALHRHVIAPEGRIFFAGEHASLTHTWMQGALESALVAVREMLTVSVEKTSV